MLNTAHYKPIIPFGDADGERFLPNDEQKYWMQMEEIAQFEESNNIVACAFRPTQPHNLAVASGHKFTIYETENNEEPTAKYSSRFKFALSSLKYRSDGALLGISTQDGLLQFFDMHMAKQQHKHGPRTGIRTFKAHKCNIGSFDYDQSGRRVAIFGDDAGIKLFDLSADDQAKPCWECPTAHSDFIRTGCCSKVQPHLIASGSYDHLVRLWDTRQDGGSGSNALQEFNHNSPIEKILFFPADENLLASAGSTFVHIWDIRAGKSVQCLNKHNKTVTSLCFSKGGNYLLSAGVDKQINCFRINNNVNEEEEIRPAYSFKVEASILSLALDNEDKCMAVGMGNKLAIYRRRNEEEKKEEERIGRKRKRSSKSGEQKNNKIVIDELPKEAKNEEENHRRSRGLFAVEKRTAEEKAQRIPIEFTERHLEHVKLAKFDFLLRERQFNELVAKLMHSGGQLEPEYVVATFQQIQIRQELATALANQHEDVLRNLFTFLSVHLFRASFFDVLWNVCMKTLGIYVRKQLPEYVRNSIENFEKCVAKEIILQKELNRTLGMMNLLVKSFKMKDESAAAAANLSICAEDEKEEEEEGKKIGKNKRKNIKQNGGHPIFLNNGSAV